MIKAEVVADSLSPQGDRLTSLLITFPRIILAEVNTHRMLSKNTSSSRAIPFNKMVEVVQNNPFIPIAWQKEHKGMQGSEYLSEMESKHQVSHWLSCRDFAVSTAREMNNLGATKQLCNRLLEPFMWTTMLITGSKEGWDNFFNLRCPSYSWQGEGNFKSWEELVAFHFKNGASRDWVEELENTSTTKRLMNNKGQAEIHMMALAECIYNAISKIIPEKLFEGEWHIPFKRKMPQMNDTRLLGLEEYNFDKYTNKSLDDFVQETMVKISTAMAARTSYTVVGDEKEIDHKKMLELHDRLVSQSPPHSSPMEHCARAMSNHEYYYQFGVTPFGEADKKGWCRNFKGFIQYRHIIETKKNNNEKTMLPSLKRP